MKRTIKRGEKIMKGRFFTLILGLCLVAGSAMAGDEDPKTIASGNIPVNIYGGGLNITLPSMDYDLTKNTNNGSGTGTTIRCTRKIPAVEMFKGVVNLHGINKYTQLATTQATFDYLTTMGIYNGTVADVNFSKNGAISNWTSTQYTPGYWGTQNAVIDMYNNNPWALMGLGGMGGSYNSGWGSLGSLGGYYGASSYPRYNG